MNKLLAFEAGPVSSRRRLEIIMADSCAPMIFGVKPSNMVAFDRRAPGYDDRWFDGLCRAFARAGIASYVLCSCPARRLVLFYRPAMLRDHLNDPETKAILMKEGYRMGGTVSEMIAHLAGRIAGERKFPHEIGLFLGYPARDVAGFIQNNGNGGVGCGYWRVYHDPEGAKRRFAFYDKCRDMISDMLTEGRSLSNILTTGGKYNENVCDLLVGNG